LYAADTHALAWWLDRDPRLSREARDALVNGPKPLLIPSLVLAEFSFLSNKRGEIETARRAIQRFRNSSLSRILPFGSLEFEFFSFDLDIHDSVIVSCLQSYAHENGEQVILLTRDERITASGLVETLW
jgi:rRNA-processing protein FCF1